MLWPCKYDGYPIEEGSVAIDVIPIDMGIYIYMYGVADITQML